MLPPLLLLISLCLSAPATAAGERVALVIGNARYERQPKLGNPEKDAASVADVLRKIGFAVEQHDNLTRAAMLDTLLNFADRSRDAEVAIIYYAGHGVQVARDSVAENYLVPVDAALADVRKVADETLPLSRVRNELGDRRGVLILLLDACRDNPLAAQMSGQGSRAVTRSGLAPVAEGAVSQGSLVAFAAGAGKVAQDGEGSNSPFAAALVKNLPVPGIDVGRVMQWVALDVAEATGHKQQPEVVNRLLRRDELYLAAPSPALAPAMPSPSPSPLPSPALAMASVRPALSSDPGDATGQHKAGLAQLKESGHPRRGWLGVKIHQVTQNFVDGLGLKDANGAMVSGVIDGGPAEKAKIRGGDIILKFNGQDVKAIHNLPRIVADLVVGKEVPVVLWRDGKEVIVQIVLAERPADVQLAAADATKSPDATKPIDINGLGLTVAPISQELRDKLQLGTDQKAVVITDVAPNTAAAERGLKPGDVIVKVTQDTKLPSPSGNQLLDYALRQAFCNCVQVLIQGEGGVQYEVQLSPPKASVKDKQLFLAEPPPDATRSPNTTKPTDINGLGLKVAPVSQALRDKFQLGTDQKGMVITDVAPNTAASERSLKPGDVLMEVHYREVTAPSDIQKGIDVARKADLKSVLLLIQREGGVQYVPLSLPKAR